MDGFREYLALRLRYLVRGNAEDSDVEGVLDALDDYVDQLIEAKLKEKNA